MIFLLLEIALVALNHKFSQKAHKSRSTHETSDTTKELYNVGVSTTLCSNRINNEIIP